MRRSDDADVERDPFRAAEALDGFLLEHTQQLHLYVERQIADLVEKQRGQVRELEAADLPRQRAGVGAPLAAEQLALNEGRRDGGAIDADHHPGAPRAELVNLRGHELFASAGFAEQQDRCTCRCDLSDLIEHAAKGRAVADDVRAPVERAHLALQVLVLVFQPIAQPAHLGERRAQLLVAALSCQHIGEHLCHQAQAVDQIAWPRSFVAHRPEGGYADDAAADQQRHRHGRLRANTEERLAIAGVWR